MKALGKHPRIDGLVQISDGRRNAFEGGLDLASCSWIGTIFER
jgi:hypothetical protein